MNGEDAIGWTASAVLLATLIRQVWTQARDKDAAGVSRWLFVGQMSASVLFIAYSVLVDNWVFVVSNVCILITAVVGQWVTTRDRGQRSA